MVVKENPDGKKNSLLLILNRYFVRLYCITNGLILSSEKQFFPANKYMPKINNWRRTSIFINLDHILHLFLVHLLSTIDTLEEHVKYVQD